MKDPIFKQKKHFYSFGPYRLYRAERELFLGDQPIDLPPKELDALLLLVSRRGHVVGKDEFMAALWPDTFVEESSLTKQVSDLRKALDPGADNKPFIETVPRRGYRFAAEVTDSWSEEQAEPQLEVVEAPQKDAEAGVRRRRVALLAVGLAAAAALLAAGVFLGMRLREPSPSAAGPLRQFGFTPPVVMQANTIEQHANLAVSPDGRHIVFTALAENRLWVYDLERGESHPLEGTEGADDPFWSPDSESIAYFSGAQIRKIPAQGGPAMRLYQRPGSTQDRGGDNRLKGGTWSPDGDSIVFSEDGSLFEIPAQGGVPELLVAPEESPPAQEPSGKPWGLIRWPHFAPAEAGARVLLYTFGTVNERTMMVHDLEDGRQEILGPGELPFYAPSGHVLHQAGPTDYDLWALPFSWRTFAATGPAFPIAQNARLPMAASDGTLVYLDLGGGAQWRLVWIDRQGKNTGTIGEPHHTIIRHTALSPDGRRVAVSAADSGNYDVWIHDVERPVKTRLTQYEGQDLQPRWSPQGDRIAFSSGRSGDRDVYVVRSDGSGDPNLLYESPDSREDPDDWSADENILVFSRYPEREVFYLSRQEVGDGYEETLFVEGAWHARLSPDGRYLAYESQESGRTEIYVRSFPGGADRQRVSLNGGTNVRWRRDGKELFYVEIDTLMAVPASTSPRLTIGSPQGLFSVDPSAAGASYYDVAPDGQRFVLPEPVEESSNAKIRIVQNWYEEFRDREQD